MKLENKPFLLLFLIYLIVGIYPAFQDKLDIHLWFNQFHHPYLDTLFKYITYLGDGFGVLISAGIFLFIEYRYSIFIILGGYLPGVITQILKRLVFADQNRPSVYLSSEQIDFISGVDLHQNFSFPSGHSTSAFALFCCLSFIIKKPLYQSLFFILALTASLSRIYLHQHFYRDTLAGALIGVLGCVLVYYFLYPKFANNRALSKSLLSPKSQA